VTDPLDRAAAAFQDGQAVLFVNEIRDIGVVGAPAGVVSAVMMNFLVSVCRGVVYVAVPEQRLASLDIPPQPHTESGPGHVHVPVDAVADVTTGISAADRARTVHALIDDDARPRDHRQPGHITPMAMHPDGLLGPQRHGHSEQYSATPARL
jgi:3,4-dihydroxy 2-butanone 4-phosphate synthase